MVNYYNIAGRKIGSHHVRTFGLLSQTSLLRQEYSLDVDGGIYVLGIIH